LGKNDFSKDNCFILSRNKRYLEENGVEPQIFYWVKLLANLKSVRYCLLDLTSSYKTNHKSGSPRKAAGTISY
jgi:hypothetical protein